MLGLADFNIFLVFILCILSTIFCVVYGVINWNRGEDADTKTDYSQAIDLISDLANQEV